MPPFCTTFMLCKGRARQGNPLARERLVLVRSGALQLQL